MSDDLHQSTDNQHGVVERANAAEILSAQHIEALPVTWAGRFLYGCIPFRRRVVMANIQQVYADTLNDDQKVHLAKAFYSHVATCLKEFLWMRVISQKRLREMVEVRGHEHMLAVAAQQKGVLVLTGHFGNWELAPIGGILNFTQFQGQFHFIRRVLVNKFVERLVFKDYTDVGLNVIPQKNSLSRICDVLEQNHAVIFVMDQHAIVSNRDGIAVEFFGKKAGTYRSLATISQYTGVPVVPAANYRLPNGKHVLEFYPPIPYQDYPSRQEALYQNTRTYNQALERMILAHPEQWSWFHKRWKLKKKHLI